MGNGESTVDMNGPEAAFIQNQISQSCVVIFSKASCPYCRSCLKTFKQLQVTPQVIDLNQRQDGSTLQDVLENMTGARTVPRVFVNGKCIGGNSETKALYDRGKLAELVADCGS